MQLAVGDVDRDHVLGAVLEQVVGEAAGRRAGVEGVAGFDLYVWECLEGVLELDAAAGDVAVAFGDEQLFVRRDGLARLVDPAAAPGELDVAGHDRGGCFGAGFEEASFDEEYVYALALLRHGASLWAGFDGSRGLTFVFAPKG